MKKRGERDIFRMNKFGMINRVDKITIGIFLFVSILSIILSFWRYKTSASFYVLFMVLLFNLSLGILLIMLINKVIKISQRSYPIFIFYLVISGITYWYVVSALLHFYYGSFLSLGGYYYFISTRGFLSAFIFYAGSGISILSISFFLYFISKKKIFKKKEKEEVVNKKIKFLLIIAPIFLLIVIVMIMPETHANQSSPFLDILIYFFKIRPPEIPVNESGDDLSNNEILNINLKTENPNIIIIMLESLPAEHVSYYGYEREITPNIDEFAEKGIVFNYSYSHSSHSDYAQTAFLSSRYMLVNSYRNPFDMGYPRVFIWDILKKSNYSTAYISSQDDDWANMKEYYIKDNLDLYADSLYDEEYDYGSGNARKDYDEKTIKSAVEWINKTNNSFFLYVNLQATHYPYSYPENNSLFLPDEASGYTNYLYLPEEDFNASLNDYDNSIYYVDRQVGVLLEYLKNKGLYNNSIIILTSDHGETIENRHGLRHGFGVYEEETRVPLIIYFPNQKHEVINKRVREIDVVPTILDIAGFNLSKEFQGEVMKENENVYLVTQNQNFKLGIIKGDIKYMVNGFTYVPEVYNLSEDPYEKNNLVKEEGELGSYFGTSLETLSLSDYVEKDDSARYYKNYGYFLYKWYNCQLDYYENEKWTSGEVINCS